MVRRLAIPVLWLIAPAILLATGCGLGHRAEMFRSSRPAADRRPLAVRADLPAGKMEVSSGSLKDLYDLRLSYCKDHFRPLGRFRESGEEGGVPRGDLLEIAAVPLGDQPQGRGTDEPNLLALSLRPGIPLDLRLSVGGGEMDLDLTALGVSRLAIHGGSAGTRLRFRGGNSQDLDLLRISAGEGPVRLEGLGWGRVKGLEFHGGAGEASLDWEGPGPPEAAAFLDPGTGSLSLLFPGDLGVSLSGERLDPSSPFPGFLKKGNGWLSSNWEKAERHLALVLDPGEGAVRFAWKQ